MSGPDFTFERAAPSGPVCGVDEAGRAPWAGPVVAAAAILDPVRIPVGIDDSKKLSARRREALFAALKASAEIGLGVASVEEIDRVNILQASFLAMRRAIAALPRRPGYALIDGRFAPSDLGCPGEAVVGGDGRSLSIAAASIAAKVTRDRVMADLARAHPEYGWERNAGYGVPAHRAALEAYGVTPHHRRSFAPIHKMLYKDS